MLFILLFSLFYFFTSMLYALVDTTHTFNIAKPNILLKNIHKNLKILKYTLI